MAWKSHTGSSGRTRVEVSFDEPELTSEAPRCISIDMDPTANRVTGNQQTKPAVLDWLERHAVHCVLGMQVNAVLNREAQPLVTRAAAA